MTHPTDSEPSLARRAASGDAEAFGELVRLHQDRIYRLCLGWVGPSGAEEAAQEVFLKAYNAIGRFEGRSAFSTWLYRIGVRHCLDVLERRKRERAVPLEAAGEVPAEGAERWEVAQSLSALLDRLEPRDRTLLVLREVEGLDYRELAEALEISVDAVKVGLHRARRRLAETAQNSL